MHEADADDNGRASHDNLADKRAVPRSDRGAYVRFVCLALHSVQRWPVEGFFAVSFTLGGCAAKNGLLFAMFTQLLTEKEPDPKKEIQDEMFALVFRDCSHIDCRRRM
jgi:hypothetical protein